MSDCLDLPEDCANSDGFNSIAADNFFVFFEELLADLTLVHGGMQQFIHSSICFSVIDAMANVVVLANSGVVVKNGENRKHFLMMLREYCGWDAADRICLDQIMCYPKVFMNCAGIPEKSDASEKILKKLSMHLDHATSTRCISNDPFVENLIMDHFGESASNVDKNLIIREYSHGALLYRRRNSIVHDVRLDICSTKETIATPHYHKIGIGNGTRGWVERLLKYPPIFIYGLAKASVENAKKLCIEKRISPKSAFSNNLFYEDYWSAFVVT